MVDFILLAFFLGSAYGGFKLGNKFKTLGEAFSAGKARIKEMLT